MTAPPVVAHRGLAARFPENTLAAFRAALEAGARFLEVDLQVSADGIAYVHHDWDTLRTCGVPGTIGDQRGEALSSLCAGYSALFGDEFADEPLPTLADLCDFMSEWPGVTVFLEIKPKSVERFGASAVLDAVLPHAEPLGEDSVLLSFSQEVLLAARDRSPLARGVACDRHTDLTTPAVAAIDPRHVFCDVDLLSTDGPLAIEDRTLTVWEVVDADRAQRLLDRGVDLIESFSCDTLIEALTPAEE